MEAIHADLASPRRMRRLVQGDVGSGKTIVAVLALLRAVEDGDHQGAPWPLSHFLSFYLANCLFCRCRRRVATPWLLSVTQQRRSRLSLSSVSLS